MIKCFSHGLTSTPTSVSISVQLLVTSLDRGILLSKLPGVSRSIGGKGKEEMPAAQGQALRVSGGVR